MIRARLALLRCCRCRCPVFDRCLRRIDTDCRSSSKGRCPRWQSGRATSLTSRVQFLSVRFRRPPSVLRPKFSAAIESRRQAASFLLPGDGGRRGRTGEEVASGRGATARAPVLSPRHTGMKRKLMRLTNDHSSFASRDTQLTRWYGQSARQKRQRSN